MTAGRSADEEAQRRREKARRLEQQARNFERGAEGERRIAAVLDQLPDEFVVFHDVQLPGSKANVDHLVVGPGGVFLVDSKFYSNPVTMGRGRGADTLWTARTPLRKTLDTTAWEAGRVSELLGCAVEPVICMIAPSLPQRLFVFRDMCVCGPERLHDAVTKTSGGASIDVVNTAMTVGRVFGVQPAPKAVPAPEAMPALKAVRALGRPSGAVGPRPRNRPERQVSVRSTVRVVFGLIDRPWFRPVVSVFGFFVLIALLPTLTGVVTGVFQSAAEQATDSMQSDLAARRAATEPATSSTTATTTTTVHVLGPPPAVRYSVSCLEGGGHLITFAWPGEPPDGAAGYDIRWQLDDGPVVLLTLDGWTDAQVPPAEQRSPAAERTTLITDYRDVDGVDSTIERVETDLVCP